MGKNFMFSLSDLKYSKYKISLHSTFQTALRSVNDFEVYKLNISSSDNTLGCGEVVATPAITGVTADQLEQDIHEKLIPLLQNKNFLSVEDAYSQIEEKLPLNPTARALGDLAISSLFKSSETIAVKTDVTLPITEVTLISDLIKRRINDGFNVFKMKLGAFSLTKNIEMVQKTFECLSESATLRIDPNQAWSVDYSLQFLERLDKLKLKIDYLEQPINRFDFDGLAKIHQNTDVPIMADESCFDIEDLERLISINAIDWVNVKILKSGGVTPARKIAMRAKEAGLKLSFGCMIESPLGVRAAMELAQEFEPLGVHDLDAAWWYQQSELTYSDGIVQ
jgi:L-alanine-DL-glutamate epimerase-like enolase superfamily enzyme